MSDFVENTGNFDSWLKSEYTYVSPKFEVADLRSSNQGRGLIATDDIKEDETLFELSRDSILNVETAELGKLQDGANKEYLLGLGQWEALILCFAYELSLAEKSKWYNYFKVLPSELNSLMFWSDEELKSLKPSLVVERVGKEQAEFMYSQLVAVHCVELKVPELATFLSLEKFHIIASWIMSYSFDVDHPEEVEDDDEEHEEEEEEEVGEADEEKAEYDHEHGDEHSHEHEEEEEEEEEEETETVSSPVSDDTYFKSMVPLADTLNSDTTLFNATLRYEATKLVMKSTKEIKKGEQIYNIYAEQPNAEILRRYGYVELPSSKHEFGEVKIENVKAYYNSKYDLGEEVMDKIIDIVGNSEYLDETLEDNEGGIVIPTYECFADGDVLTELSLLVIILTTLYESFKSDNKWFKKLYRTAKKPSGNEFEQLVNRTILKCYQLLESGRTTTLSAQSLSEIIDLRMKEYPECCHNVKFEDATKLTRQDMASVVLNCEYNCLKACQAKGSEKLSVIEDEKLLRNVLKRKYEEDEKKNSKRSRK